jgi:membrane protein DedA with SNARE-associated domain
VLVQQLGAPIPAMPVLLLAGAHAAADPFYGVYALALAILASALGSLRGSGRGGVMAIGC